MGMVFLILWIVTVVAGLGATGYGLYQLMEEPLGGWRKKRATAAPAKSSSAEPVPATINGDEPAEYEEDDEEFENLTMTVNEADEIDDSEAIDQSEDEEEYEAADIDFEEADIEFEEEEESK